MTPWSSLGGGPMIYDVRARPNVVESTTGSRDLQMVNTTLRVLSTPVADMLPTSVNCTLGEHYAAERVVPSIVHETLKAVVAQYNASQLITQRELVSREIRRILVERAATFNIALDDVSITNLTIGGEFTAAIETKQVAVAQQEVDGHKCGVENAEQDKRIAVIRAQGEARRASLIGEAISRNPAFITLRKTEGSRDIACSLPNSQNKVFLNSDSLLLDLQNMESVPSGTGDTLHRERSGDFHVIVNVCDRKVRLISDLDSTSLYALCRRWVRNDVLRRDQSLLWDCPPLPRPVPAATATGTCKKEESVVVSQAELPRSIESMTEEDLLQHHVEHFKGVRKRFRDDRSQRIARFMPRLALLLPVNPENTRRDADQSHT